MDVKDPFYENGIKKHKRSCAAARSTFFCAFESPYPYNSYAVFFVRFPRISVRQRRAAGAPDNRVHF